jgi:hypothetical protein
MFTNTFVTVTGIMGTMLGIPLAVITYYATIVKTGPPDWFMHYLAFPMVLIGTIGIGLSNAASKGKDQHSIPAQVQAAGAAAKAVTPEQTEQANEQVKQADMLAAKKP